MPLKSKRTRAPSPPTRGSRGDAFGAVEVLFLPHPSHKASAQNVQSVRLVERGAELADVAGLADRDARHLFRLPVRAASGCGGVKVVRQDWVVDSLAACKPQPEAPYVVAQPKSAVQPLPPPLAAQSASVGLWERWMGLEIGDPERFEQLTIPGRMVHGRFDQARCEALGNMPLFRALKEVAKYEEALAAEEGSLHSALAFHHAAAIVCAAAFRLDKRSLASTRAPAYLVSAVLKQAIEFLQTGQCERLERLRANKDIKRSGTGSWRGVEGAHSKRMFQKLPGVGVAIASQWYNAGCRTFEEAATAASEGRLPRASPAVRHSLLHHDHFTEPVSGADATEMREAVLSALAELADQRGVSAEGWELTLAGGGRRGRANHDSDYLLTNHLGSMKGIASALYECLLDPGAHPAKGGRLLPAAGGQAGEPGSRRGGESRGAEGHVYAWYCASVRVQRLAPEKSTPPLGSPLGAQELEGSGGSRRARIDLYDHLFAVFRTSAGRLRRLDVVCVPAEYWGFGLLGWTGSTQWLRFLKEHVRKCGMWLTSHGLYRLVGGEMRRVPQDVPPLSAEGAERWPPGWHAGRRVRGERDVFELLALEWREPRERNC
eukprot:jgi/Tetstr1/457156/TSEL_043806.t1